MRTEEIMETAKDRAGQKEIIRAVATGADRKSTRLNSSH